MKKSKPKRFTKSFLIALWMLTLTTAVSICTMKLMFLCVGNGFAGAMYPLTALITMCQAGNAIVLTAVTNKSKAENTAGGIVFETAVQRQQDCD